MGPLELAIVVALGFAVLLSAFDLLPITTDGKEFPTVLWSTLIVGVVCFLALWGLNFLFFYFWRPALTGPLGGWIPILVINTSIALVFYAINNVILQSFRAGCLISLLAFLIIGFIGLGNLTFPFFSDESAKELAHLVQVIEQPEGAYPDTDADHILLIPQEAALFKAQQIVAQASDEQGRNLSTLFNVYEPALQSVNNHLYWIFNLRISGWRVSNQINRIVPGYIVVDAEDPNANDQIRLGYRMEYTIGAPTRNSADRHIYNSGYRGWQIDDLTIEIRDDWKPFYSASLNKRVKGFMASVPEKMILMDPENGEIQEYALNDIPEWVDRVYSAKVAHAFMDYWGHWANAPWEAGGIGETSANRSMPAAHPNLVYTKSGHPAWQVLMTSWNQDTSVISIILFEGRSNTAKMYKISGIAIEESALEALRTTKKLIRPNIIPVHPSIHKIYGRLTWVAPYISLDENADGAGPFQGIGVVPVDNVNGANVLVADSKNEVFREYRQFLARGSANVSLEENSLKKSIAGRIVDVAQVVIAGNTNYLILLDSDSAHVFQGAIDENLKLPFAEPGKRVQITFLDVGKKNVDIIDYSEIQEPSQD